MNITNFPAKSSLQVMESVAWGDNQQVATGTKSAPSLNETAGVPEGPAPGEANTAGEGSVRTKRGFKSLGLPRVFSRPKPNIPQSPGLAGTYKSLSDSVPRPPVGPPNTPGITNFRNLAFKTQHPGSPISGPVKPAVAKPTTFGDVAGNLIAADRLVKAGVFKTGPSLKTVTRDAVVNATVNGLVSTPLSIGTYAGSVWSGETIKGNFSANTPLLPPAHLPAPSQMANGVAAASGTTGEQDAATINLRLDNAELKMLLLTNTLQTLVEGGEGKALGKSPDWPTGVNERLETLDKIYSGAEKALQAVAEENEFIFKPYKDESATGSSSVTHQLDVLDKRSNQISKSIGRMVAVRELEEKEKGSIV